MSFSTTEPPFRFRQGSRPLLISMPHVGTHVPPALAARFTAEAQQVPDTDWHLERLYDFADALGASVLVATHSRYVIDLNRAPDGASLYPGQSVTGLCPVDTFDDTPVYRDAADHPGEAEIAARRDAIWHPYHAQLAAELARIKAQHGIAMLWDAHSIRSVLPRFFEGKLPDLNLGTAQGQSCDLALAERLRAIAKDATGYTSVLNGRFTGGYITRHHGRPQDGQHAVQLEMTQSSYMQEALPFDYLPAVAAGVQPHLQRLLQAVLDFAETPR
jgi:N-formylglutamate deformylase